MIGYICRAVGHGNPESVTVYALQNLFILLAPLLYAASIYMVLGRLIRYLHAEPLSIVRVTWMTKIFVASDAISFLTQAAGMDVPVFSCRLFSHTWLAFLTTPRWRFDGV